MIPGGATAKKTHGATIDDFFRIESRRAVDLAPKPEFGIFIGAYDAGLALAQAGQHFLSIVTDG
jgi:hypothetical protein